MPQSMTNFDNALKDFYGPGLKESVNNSNPILTEATRNDEDFQGRAAVWSLHTGRSNSTGARAELGALPSADRQRYSQPREDLAYIYHTVKVSGVSKHLTRNNEGAFTRALEAELDGAEKDLKNDLARQVLGQSVSLSGTFYTGVIATLSADPGTGTTFTFGSETEGVMRQFFVGEEIQAFNPATATARSGGPYEITAVDTAAKTVTVSAAIDASVGSADWIVRAASTSAGDNNFGNEINGLRHLISSTSTFAGIAPATVPAWASLTFGSSTTTISETVLDQAAEKVETDGDGSRPRLFVSEHKQRAKLAQQLQAQKQYEGRQMTLTAGWEGLKVAQGVLVCDRYCPSDTMFAITPKYLVHFVGLDWTWDDDDGKILYKALDGSDAVEARFKTYQQLAVTVRNAHTRITLAVPTLT